MRYLTLALILLSLVACGEGGGGGSGGSSTPPPAPHIFNYSASVLSSGGTLSGEHATFATVDTTAGTIQFSTVTEGTVNSTVPTGMYHSAGGVRIYTAQFSSSNLRLTFFRTSDNTNFVVWQLTLMSSSG